MVACWSKMNNNFILFVLKRINYVLHIAPNSTFPSTNTLIFIMFFLFIIGQHCLQNYFYGNFSHHFNYIKNKYSFNVNNSELFQKYYFQNFHVAFAIKHNMQDEKCEIFDV